MMIDISKDELDHMILRGLSLKLAEAAKNEAAQSHLIDLVNLIQRLKGESSKFV